MAFITNRTQGDVARRAELARKGIVNMTETELAEWLAPSKGAYNYTDLNRVEEAVAKIGSYLIALDRDGVPYPTRSWSVSDVPNAIDMQRYIANVKAIRSALPELHHAMPQAPASMVNLTYEGANAIEEILSIAMQYVESKIQTFPFSGEIYGGEV